jgi:glucosylceramidase
MTSQIKILIVILLLVNNFRSSSQNVTWISSTEQNKWVQHDLLTLKKNIHSDKFDVEIIPSGKQQTIDGWGGCFNELGWDALMSLDSVSRTAVIKEFFDPNEGLKYNICRIPIGANDYALNWYSLDEKRDDYEMKNFNIDRDKTSLIPYIKAAMLFRPDLQIWASPWSPPIWMKTNNHYANKPGDHNDLTEANAVRSGDQLIQKKEILSAYALYLAKFSIEYHKQGINLFAIQFQNEPYTYNQWPNCSWTAHAMRDFVSLYLGPTFKKEKVQSQIWFGTINNSNIAVFDTVLSNPGIRRYISGVGFQYEGKEAVDHVYRFYPELKRMETETPCGGGTFDWKSAEETFETIKFYMDKGVNSYMYWNMILDSTGESSWGWKQNAQVTIDKLTKKVTYTPEFYLFKHLSSFVTPGSVKIKSEGSFKNLLAYCTPQGKIIVVTMNSLDSQKPISIKIGNKILSMTLPAKSFNTFTFKL